MDDNVLHVLRQLHSENTRRIDILSKDLNDGFEKVRDEMRVQNGRVSKNEIEVATVRGEVRVVAERLVPVQRAVYSVIGLMGAGFVGAIMALVFAGHH